MLSSLASILTITCFILALPFIYGYNLELNVKDLQKYLHSKSIDLNAKYELCDSNVFYSSGTSTQKIVDKISKSFEHKIHRYRKQLKKSVDKIRNLTITNYQGLPLCCDMDKRELNFDEYFGSFIRKDVGCFMWNASSSFENHELANIFMNKYEGSKSHYYFSPENQNIFEYPAKKISCDENSRHHQIYFSAHYPKPKYVLILMDWGNSMSHYQINLARKAVQFITSTLSNNDYLGFVSFSDSINYPLSQDCPFHPFVRFSNEVNVKLTKFISVHQTRPQATNHTMAFNAINDIIKNSNILADDDIINLIYISNGKIRSNFQKEQIFKSIKNLNKKTPQKIIFNSYLTSNFDKFPETEDIDFMKDLSRKNFENNPGHFVVLDDNKNNFQEIGRKLYQFENLFEFTINPPYWDSLRQNAFVNFAAPIFKKDIYLGATAFDVDYNVFIEDFEHFSNQPNSYVTLVTTTIGGGLKVVFHPLYNINYDKHVDLSDIEPINEIKDKILSQDQGIGIVKKENKSFYVTWKITKNNFIVIHFKSKRKNSLCESTGFHDQKKNISHINGYLNMLEMQTVSLDFNSNSNKCQYLGDLVTFDYGSLLLTFNAFSSNSEPNNGYSFKAYMAYITDQTNLLTNPGLKENIRYDITVLSYIINAWKNDMKNYKKPTFIEKYAASSSGAYVSYPGSKILSDRSSFQKQDWFLKALEFPGRIILSPPKLHHGGGGYVITLSQSFDHGTNDNEVTSNFVVGMDISLKEFEDHIFRIFPQCVDINIRCFIFNDLGHLVYHSIMTDPTYIGSIDSLHLNFKESDVGKDLLSFKELVTKKACKNYDNSQITRSSYKYNFDSSKVFNNSINSCNTYEIIHIEQTNLFMGILNSTCDSTSVFCPCNTKTKDCLICPFDTSEMNTLSCECPCQCKSDTHHSNSQCKIFPVDKNTLSPCPIEPIKEEIVITSGFKEEEDSLFESCFSYTCDSFTNSPDCNSFPGCNWCMVKVEPDQEVDLSTFYPLRQPQCKDQNVCFRGALGSPSPYKSQSQEDMLVERPENSRSGIGPIIGGVLVFFLFLAFSAFCYHQHSGIVRDGSVCINMRSRRTYYRNSTEAVFEGRSIEADENDEYHEMNYHKNMIALSSIENPAAISPYRMNPGYRRPAMGTDSDHGYSTMTPMGGDLDSEATQPYIATGAKPRQPQQGASFATASLPSVTSGFSSRTSSPIPTQLNKMQQILSPLTQNNLEENSQLLESETENEENQETTVLKPYQFIVAATVHMSDVP